MPNNDQHPAPKIYAASISLLGKRKSQQDAFDYRYLDDGAFAAVVCDGMGGLNGGERAARAGCDGFFEEYSRMYRAHGRVNLETIARRLDQKVAALTESDGRALDGGSTLVAAVVKGHTFHWLSVGDSRIGLVQNGHFFWLNRLHNFRMELDEALSLGEITRGEYEAGLPKGAALLSYLGCGELRYIDARYKLPLNPGDMLLLCSDGFYGLWDEARLNAVLGGLNETAANFAELMLPYITQPGKPVDNATAVIIRSLAPREYKPYLDEQE